MGFSHLVHKSCHVEYIQYTTTDLRSCHHLQQWSRVLDTQRGGLAESVLERARLFEAHLFSSRIQHWILLFCCCCHCSTIRVAGYSNCRLSTLLTNKQSDSQWAAAAARQRNKHLDLIQLNLHDLIQHRFFHPPIHTRFSRQLLRPIRGRRTAT